MLSTLDALLKVIDELEDFVGSIEPVNSMLASHEDTLVRRYLTIRRRLDYAAFIVVLYAAFEKFVEDLAWSYTELASSRTKYAELPKNLCDKHLRASGELLARAHLGEGRYAGLGHAEIVSNLYQCLLGEQSYKLNKHAIIHHDANLRSDVVQSVFTSIGIEKINEWARQAEPMVNWYCQAHGLEIAPKGGVPEKPIELRVKDLVERRNQVAHSGGDPGESLSPTELRERLAFIRAYCHSLYTVLVGVYLHKYYVKKPDASAKLVGPIGRPCHDGHVVIVHKPTCRVYVGQAIFGARQGRVDRWGYVKGIQIDDNFVQSVEADSPASHVGLRIDFKSTRNTELYLLQRKDDMVWR